VNTCFLSNHCSRLRTEARYSSPLSRHESFVELRIIFRFKAICESYLSVAIFPGRQVVNERLFSQNRQERRAKESIFTAIRDGTDLARYQNGAAISPKTPALCPPSWAGLLTVGPPNVRSYRQPGLFQRRKSDPPRAGEPTPRARFRWRRAAIAGAGYRVLDRHRMPGK
jgi:hypothetical protein